MVTIPSHDWIQTSQNITIIFYIKDILPQSIVVDCVDSNCKISFKSADVLYEKKFENLKTPITYSTHNLTANKLELVFIKSTLGYWSSLHKLDPADHKSANKNKKFEYSDSEPDNNTTDESFMKLLKDIYSKGDEKTKRAMNKSFQTSGGRVLSTNWNAVKDSNP